MRRGQDLTRQALSTSEVPSAWAIPQRFSLWIGGAGAIVLPMPLIWGRHDHATRLPLAEAASARYGWPLHVIEHVADGPPIEQPETFVRAPRSAAYCHWNKGASHEHFGNDAGRLGRDREGI